MAQRANADQPEEEPFGSVRGAVLEPIRVVRRELTRPDGTKVVAEVPVYPPFRLAERPVARKPARSRAAPALKRRRLSRPPQGRGEEG